MAEHTPGTWVAQPHQFGGGCWWVDTRDGSIQVSMKTPNKDEANARFIAAAPDMEKALEAWLEWDGEIREGLSPPMLARAALAKAKGRD